MRREEAALKYDFIRSGHLLERRFEIVKDLIDKVKTNQTKLIGEIGSGPGRLSYLIANQFRDCRVKAFELNKEFVKYAKKKFQGQNLFYQIFDIEKFKLPKEFDVLLTVDLLHHLNKPNLAIENIKNSLKREKAWIIIEPNIYNVYIFLFQLLTKNEGLFYQSKTEKQFFKGFDILEKRYAFIIHSSFKTPPRWLRYLEKKFENNRIFGGSVIYLLKKI